MFSEMVNDELAQLDRDGQREYLINWFQNNFEDPANETPYDSEDGYIYIWGGPFEPYDVLSTNFDGVVSEEVITEVTYELEDILHEWAPKPSSPFYESPIEPPDDPFVIFQESMFRIEKSIDLISDYSPVKSFLVELLYANVITSLEVYFGDTLSHLVLNNERMLRKFVENYRPFRKMKFTFAELYEKQDEVRGIVKAELDKILWHNANIVKPLYRNVLSISFSNEQSCIFSSVDDRHHIVHRNGKRLDGTELNIQVADLENLLRKSIELVSYIEGKLPASDIDEDELEF